MSTERRFAFMTKHPMLKGYYNLHGVVMKDHRVVSQIRLCTGASPSTARREAERLGYRSATAEDIAAYDYWLAHPEIE